jgi:hypothetical protein
MALHDDTVQEYTEALLRDYKIQIIHQVLRSPETNLLDLGIWRSIQLAIEQEHRFKVYDQCQDALACSFERAWNQRLYADIFTQVYESLLKVLQLIVLDNGNNNMMEERRGKIFGDPVDMTDSHRMTSWS